jgi:pimeloyl-ACP methyl ester carboxylesterase
MQNRDKNACNIILQSEHMPLAPPLNDADIRGTVSERSGRLFTRVAKGVGVVVCTTAIVAPLAKQLDTIVFGSIWPNDKMEVQYVPSVEGTVAEYKKEAYIAFPGVGQKDTKNAATEHFNAINHTLPTAYVSLPNQGFTIQELAHEVDSLIDENNLDKVNIIGVSAGTQLALQTITYIEEHPEEFIEEPDEEPLPEIGYFLANSSPYDEMSAYKGPIIQPTMNMLDATNYRAGIAEKFVYSLVDGPGDINNLLPNSLHPINISYVFDSITQTFNATASTMVQDHLTVLNEIDAEEQKNTWKKVLTPTTKFLYFYPSKGQDLVVDNEKAYRQFSETLQKLDVSTEYVPIESTEHADTVQAAVAFGNWLIQLQQPVVEESYNPYPKESNKPITS